MTQPTWSSTDAPPQYRLGPLAVALVAIRGLALILLIFGGLLLLLVLRLIERPLFGMRRPLTPWITVLVCRTALRIIGLSVTHHGTPMSQRGMIVANHSSWLDIFVLNSAGPVYFVSKSDVAGWPGIGWLARATGTFFVERDRRKALLQADELEKRLTYGHRLLLFPEGTSTDGQRVLPFKSTLFAALFSPNLADQWAQPACVAYHAPGGQDARFYCWWGDMELGPHLAQMLGTLRHGRVDVWWLAPSLASGVTDRKSLSADLEAAVRQAHPQGAMPSSA